MVYRYVERDINNNVVATGEWDSREYKTHARLSKSVENSSAINTISNAFRNGQTNITNIINKRRQQQRRSDSSGGGGRKHG